METSQIKSTALGVNIALNLKNNTAESYMYMQLRNLFRTAIYDFLEK